MVMSPKKGVDGVEGDLTPRFVVVTEFASLVMESNQPVCGCLPVISSEPTIQPNRPSVAT
jgi:hypothetical protein